MPSNAVATCRLWLQGKLYPNTSREDFLSLLMGNYKLSAHDAAVALSDAEWVEQFQDQPEIAGVCL